MEEISVKLGLYDFFNVLLAGGLFVFSVFFMSHKVLDFYANKVLVVFNTEFEKILVLLFLCYIIGIVFQEIASFCEEKIFHIRKSMLKNFLIVDSIVENKPKLEVFRNLAYDILNKKLISHGDNDISGEQCHYVYAYCFYYVQNRGMTEKIEKIRALYGMSKTFTVVFFAIAFVALIKISMNIFLPNIVINELPLTISFFISSVFLMILFFYRMKKNMKYMIRMIMSTYEACVDKMIETHRPE